MNKVEGILVALLLVAPLFFAGVQGRETGWERDVVSAIERISEGRRSDVKAYGAKGDGKTLDTEAINQAMESCASKGGGVVYFPEGTYLSGSIHLKSNVILYLDEKAAILGAPNELGIYDFDPYPYNQFQDFGHSHWRNALLWGENLENVGIMGKGTINGGGMTRGDPSPGGGDKAISLKECRNILIRDIRILHAGHFGILPTGCENMVIDSLLIDTNRDGINIDCCRNVSIKNCRINSPLDDAIVPKSSYALGRLKPCENITITDCYVSGYDEGSLASGEKRGGGGIGRIKFGTESNGGFKNVTVKDCTFESCWGLALEIVDGGTMENFSISNITMKDVAVPVFIRLGNRSRGPRSPPPGEIRNVTIKNLKATVYQGDEEVFRVKETLKHPSIISGIPEHPVGDNVCLENIEIVYRGGGKKEDTGIEVPEREEAYPEPSMFGPLPSYGLYCRHARGIEFKNVSVSFAAHEERPALIFEDIDGIKMEDVSFKATEKPIVFKDVKNYSGKLLEPAVTDLKFKEKVRPNEEFDVTVHIEGKEGLNGVFLYVDGEKADGQHIWLKKPTDIRFFLRLYEPGKHEIKVGNKAGSVFVAPAEGKLVYEMDAFTPIVDSEPSTALVANETTRIIIKIKNVGGSAAESTGSFDVNGTAIYRVSLNLKPGEEKVIELPCIFSAPGYYELEFLGDAKKIYVWNCPGSYECRGIKAPKDSISGEPFTVLAAISNTEYNPEFFNTKGSRVELYVDGEMKSWSFAMAKKNEDEEVKFDIAIEEPGAHEIRVKDRVLHVSVKPRPSVPTFKCVGIAMPSSYFVSEEIDISAPIKNIGAKGGKETIELFVDGKMRNREEVYVEPAEVETVNFSCSFERPGEHRVKIGGIEKEIAIITHEIPVGVFLGEYFNNMDLSGRCALARIDDKINFDWEGGSPQEGVVNNESFSARWQSIFIPEKSGAYRFYMTSDDGARLYIDDKILIDSWHDRGASTDIVDINLAAGERHTIKVEYYEHAGDAIVSFRWLVI